MVFLRYLSRIDWPCRPDGAKRNPEAASYNAPSFPDKAKRNPEEGCKSGDERSRIVAIRSFGSSFALRFDLHVGQLGELL